MVAQFTTIGHSSRNIDEEWRTLLTEAGFIDLKVPQAPMHLLKMSRILADEGLWRTLKFVRNVLADGDARRRVLDMGAVFNKHADHIRGIASVGTKPTWRRRRPGPRIW
jgi:hypothetical protein